jgi:acetate kinase
MAVPDPTEPERTAAKQFCHSVRKHLSPLSVVLGGVDQIVFARSIIAVTWDFNA